MCKSLVAALLSLLTVSAGHAASLTELETTWLRAGAPVLSEAARQHLPIDIIVQPQSGPADLPFAMAYVDQRCKLVLTMRGNKGATALMASMPAPLQTILIEAITAHEVGHCWRHVQGSWNALPAGMVDAPEDAAQAQPETEAAVALATRAERREEGYADLVALAWTASRHPEYYQQVYDWLSQLRSRHAGGRTVHDTGVWIEQASERGAIDATLSPFEAAAALWQEGLEQDQ